MGGTITGRTQPLSRIETAQVRWQLVSMREEFAKRAGDLDRIRLKQVDSAIRKLDKGSYGVCEACAREIHKARLIEKPYVRYCVSCF